MLHRYGRTICIIYEEIKGRYAAASFCSFWDIHYCCNVTKTLLELISSKHCEEVMPTLTKFWYSTVFPGCRSRCPGEAWLRCAVEGSRQNVFTNLRTTVRSLL